MLVSNYVDIKIPWAYIWWGRRFISGVFQGFAYLSESEFWILAFLEALKKRFGDF